MKIIEIKNADPKSENAWTKDSWPGLGAFLTSKGELWIITNSGVSMFTPEFVNDIVTSRSDVPGEGIDVHRFLDQLIMLRQ